MYERKLNLIPTLQITEPYHLERGGRASGHMEAERIDYT